MRRVEHCESCGYALYAYPSERGPFYCETVRCEQGQDAHDALTARMNEKNGPDSRQEVTGPFPESDTYQEASVMSQSIATTEHPDQHTTTHELPGSQARFILRSLSPEQPGVVQLDVITSAGDAVTMQLRHEQAQDLADVLFIAVDRFAADDDAAIEADHARLLAEGGSTLWTLGGLLAAHYDDLGTVQVVELAEALEVTPTFLLEAIIAPRPSCPWDDRPEGDRLLTVDDVFKAAQVLGVETAELAEVIANAEGAAA
ncbi:hypothetical protein [Nesterenkonia xinjiangensis]|uniref:Uncharacterized protein n=1 Tax=Nesterenkonia xinjiangensis TaxID=225327 RepID=A0A7Z0GNB5_9MICC|nr:hypothetical protein [Nesterenkonia xinjiangensis]NYJ78256.1 hypothetical protein [Nesterenkonia xinjiangensis]